MSQRISDQAIFAATVAVVVDRGYVGATTRQIATIAGINEVTLFRRFGDKRTLVLAAVNAQIDRFSEAGTHATGDLEADLLRVLEFYTRMFTEHGRLLLALITEATRDPELVEILHQPLALLAGIDDLIANYQRTGHLLPGPPELARNALVGPLLANAVIARISPDLAAEPSPRQLLDHFLQGYARKP